MYRLINHPSQSADLLFSTRELNYSSDGVGANKGHQNAYNFTLSLYEAIDRDRCTYKVSANRVDVVLEKAAVGEWWPRLTSTPQKPHWLKIDFDKWRPSKEDDEDEGQQTTEERSRPLLDDYPHIMDQVEREELGYRREDFKKVYLLIYNLVQFIGYLFIVLVMGIQYAKRGPDFIPETYQYVGNAMKFFQLLQFLEVMHPLFGYTRNSMLVPFMQTTGRGFLLFAMVEAEVRIQTKPVVFYLFLVWSLIEVVRYPYYFLNLVLDDRTKVKAFYFRWITWLRYSIWIPLYPLGVLCEGLVIIRNIVYFEETGRFSVDMPNRYNFTWDMVLFLKFYLLFLIIPGIFFMMRHMAKERAKRLNPKKHLD